jgi:PAS domain S-box-containing protein
MGDLNRMTQVIPRTRNQWFRFVVTTVVSVAAMRLSVSLGLFVTVPGTIFVIDTREVFLILGATLAGPLAGALIGLLAYLSAPPHVLAILSHVILGWWAGWFYEVFVHPRSSTKGELLTFQLLVILYYAAVYLPILLISSYLYPALGFPAPFGQHSLAELLVLIVMSLAPEFLLTFVVASLLILIVPEKYRLLSSADAKSHAGGPDSRRPDVLEKGRLSLRLTAWFMLLSVVPLMVAGVFVEKDVLRSFVLMGAGKQRETARSTAREISLHGLTPSTRAIMTEVAGKTRSLFVVDSTGKYIAHSDSSRIGSSINADFLENTVLHILTGTNGITAETESGTSVGYASIPGTGWRVVSVEGSDAIAHLLRTLQNSVFVKLSLSFFGIALIWGLVIWYIVGRPMNEMTAAAKEIGAGNLNTKVRPERMTGEIAVLARTFDEMVVHLRGAYHDMEGEIAQRKSTEEALRESEKKFRLLAENSTDLISRHDLESRYLYVSPACRTLLGCEPGEIIGRSAYDFILSDDLEKVREHHKNHLATKSAPPISFRVRRHDGSVIWFESESRIVEDPVTGGLEILVSSRDVTARVRAEEAVRESEKMFKTLVHQSTDPIYLIQNNRLVFVNKAWEEMFGYTAEEAKGSGFDLLQIVAPESRSHVEDRLRLYAGGGPVAKRYEMAGTRRDGSHIDLDVSVAIVTWQGKPAVQGIYRDITERKRHEESTRHRQKTESLGVLAGGIAHDFNNLLQSMIGQTSLALRKLAPENPAHENILKAERAAERAAELTRQLLAYSGRGTFNVRPLDLNKLIHENLRFLELAIPKDVALELELADDLPLIKADAGQMQQVVMNLIINASEAIGLRPGRIHIRTGATTISAGHLDEWNVPKERVSAGNYVRLEVADNGSGMSQAVLGKIFDPFFTTKVTGRGLGLSAVVGIVQGHHGAMRVESEEDRGTTFSLVFPVSEEPKKEHEMTQQAPNTQNLQACVLIVDDEADVREVVIDMLDDAGVRTMSAANGEEGIALFQSHPDEIDLVLLDLSMPGIGGKETFRRLKSLKPDLKIVLSSGYSQTEVTDDLSHLGLTGFIQKPYRYDKLNELIRKFLDAPPAA